MQKSPVQLGGLFDPCVVAGHTKPPLGELEYQAVKMLVDSFPNAVPREELARRVGDDVHSILTQLRKKDTGWASAILMPSRSGRGGYRLIAKGGQ